MDDGVPIRTRLGLRLADKPSLREIARRLSYCNSVAAAGQPEMSFLGETDILLGARLDLDEDQTLVAEQTAPVHKRQGDLFSKRRRGSADEVLLRAIEERQEVRQTVAKGAAVAREVQEQVGAAMNGLAAEDLPAELERIERRMQADTQPARSFIAAKQAAFDLAIEEMEPTHFSKIEARTKISSRYTAELAVCAAQNTLFADVKALVLARKVSDPAPGGLTALPDGVFDLETEHVFRIVAPTRKQAVLLAAAACLGLVVELEVRPVISSCTLAAKQSEVLRLLNVDALLAAVIQFFSASVTGARDQDAA